MPLSPEDQRAYARAHYLANKEKYKESCRVARAANPGRNAYYQRVTAAAYKAERERLEAEEDAKRQKREAKRATRGAPKKKGREPISGGVRADVLSVGYCQYCGHGPQHGVTLHVDHIKPVSKGGTNDRSNLQALCARCNLGKHASYSAARHLRLTTHNTAADLWLLYV